MTKNGGLHVESESEKETERWPGIVSYMKNNLLGWFFLSASISDVPVARQIVRILELQKFTKTFASMVRQV